MPLNGKLALTHALGGWKRGRTGRGCGERRRLRRAQRNQDGGLRADQPARQLYLEAGAIDLGVDNLFDKFYSLPLGGAYTVKEPGNDHEPRFPAWDARSMPA
jgi:iron complex outermembrane receptor protein